MLLLLVLANYFRILTWNITCNFKSLKLLSAVVASIQSTETSNFIWHIKYKMVE